MKMKPLENSWGAILKQLQMLDTERRVLLKNEQVVYSRVVAHMTMLTNRIAPKSEDAPAWVDRLVISLHRCMEPKVVEPEKHLEPMTEDPYGEIKAWREDGKHKGYWYAHAKCGLQQKWPLELGSHIEMKAVFGLHMMLAQSQLELAMAVGDLPQASAFLTGFAEAVRTAFDEKGPVLGRDVQSYPIRYLMVSHWPDVERCQCLEDLCCFLLKKLPKQARTRVGFDEMVRGVCRGCEKKFPRKRGRPREKKFGEGG